MMATRKKENQSAAWVVILLVSAARTRTRTRARKKQQWLSPKTTTAIPATASSASKAATLYAAANVPVHIIPNVSPRTATGT